MPLEFASVDEVWGDFTKPAAATRLPYKAKTKKARMAKEPTCAPFQEKVPDILSAYLDDFMGPATLPDRKQCAGQESRNNAAPQNTMEADLDMFRSDQFYEFNQNKDNQGVKRQAYPAPNCTSEEPSGVQSGELAMKSMPYDDYFSSQPHYRSRSNAKVRDSDGLPIIEKVPVFEPFDEGQDAADDIDDAATSVVTRQRNNIHADANTNALNTYELYTSPPPLPPYQAPSSKQMYMEFILYVFSGILLIFILEQVLQMGMRMRNIN